MNTIRVSSAITTITTLASFLLVAGCSSADPASTPAQASPSPDRSVVQDAGSLTCSTFESCPNVACFCVSGVVNARGCNEGRCLDNLATCTEACKGTMVQGGGSSGATDPGTVPSATPGPAAQPAAAPGDPCVPVSVSAIQHRVGAIAAIVAAHQTVPPTPAFGAVYVTRNVAGAITRIAYDSQNAAEDYVDILSYDRAGRVTYWAHDGAGTTDVNETFDYGLAGQITTYSRNAEGSTGDASERFLYDLRARLIRWSRNAEGNTSDLVETFSYDNGLIERFDRSVDGPANDVSERFNYDSVGRVTSWTTNGNGGADNASLVVSYSATSQSVQTSGTRALGATVSLCKK